MSYKMRTKVVVTAGLCAALTLTGANVALAEGDVTTSAQEQDGAVKNASGKFMIGEEGYDSLQDAVDAVKVDEETATTITLTDNAAGNGVKVQSGKKIIFDLNTFTYTIDGATVGSTGTETSGFQLLKDSDITFSNGSIVSDKAKLLVQNYSNLTLDNVKLKGGTETQCTLSNNNGDTIIRGGTSIYAGNAGEIAFDVYSFGNYAGAKVTLDESAGEIVGNIELGWEAGGAPALNIKGGNLTKAKLHAGANANVVKVKKGTRFLLPLPMDTNGSTTHWFTLTAKMPWLRLPPMGPSRRMRIFLRR